MVDKESSPLPLIDRSCVSERFATCDWPNSWPQYRQHLEHTIQMQEEASGTKTHNTSFESFGYGQYNSKRIGAWQLQEVATTFFPKKYTFHKQ